MPISLGLLSIGLTLLYMSNTIGPQLLLISIFIIIGFLVFVRSNLKQQDSLWSLFIMYNFRRWIQVEIDGMRVCADNIFSQGRTSFRNTPFLKFIEIDRGEITGIGLDDARSCTEILLVHRQMGIDDLSQNKLRELTEKLNKCLSDARDATF